MGRKLRMVPPNWDHPVVTLRNGQEGYQPMRDRAFEAAAKEWKERFLKWEAGERPNWISEEFSKMEFWEYDGPPPNRECHRPWQDSEATWFQVWETVSEGTPVTPPFATKEELIEYLVANGDFWDQKRREEGRHDINCEPWPRQAAERFVNGPGWAPSLVMDAKGVRSGVESLQD